MARAPDSARRFTGTLCRQRTTAGINARSHSLWDGSRSPVRVVVAGVVGSRAAAVGFGAARVVVGLRAAQCGRVVVDRTHDSSQTQMREGLLGAALAFEGAPEHVLGVV